MKRRLAGAPISWGVCEVPGWGRVLPRERVLREIASLGLEATELGPDGFLPDDPRDLRDLLARHRLRLSGGFVALELREGTGAALAAARRAAARLAAGGADVFVSAVFGDLAGPSRPGLDDARWPALLDLLSRVESIARDHGLTHVLHPHVGALVETDAEVRRVLDHSDVRLCLDTGHLTLGGSAPLGLARAHPERVGLVHLKDVDLGVAGRLRAKAPEPRSFLEAVRAGLFRPLGRGGVPISEVVTALEGGGYRGWYVLEQDVALGVEPAEGEGPLVDARASLDYLDGVWRAGPGGVIPTPPTFDNR
jgi:inosose dehydratase